MSRSYLVLFFVTLIFAVLRFVLPAGGLNQADIYKDLAHLFVGGLFGAAIASKRKELWALAIGLTVIEVITFFAHA